MGERDVGDRLHMLDPRAGEALERVQAGMRDPDRGPLGGELQQLRLLLAEPAWVKLPTSRTPMTLP